MEITIVHTSEFKHPAEHPILGHKDLVRLLHANHELQKSVLGIEHVWGFLDGKAVIIDFGKGE